MNAQAADKPETEPIPGIWSVDNAAYHADHSAIGSTMLKLFRKQPRKYHAIYVAKTLAPDEPSDGMRLGSALDAWLLERDKFHSLVAIGPDCDRRSSANKARWAEFEAGAAGKTIITPAQMEAVKQMAESANDSPTVKSLLNAAGREQHAIRWRDSSGLICKAKFDRTLTANFALDVKMTSDELDEYDFGRTCAKFGYHTQAAHYLAGWSAVWGETPPFFHIVFSSQEPYECGAFELQRESIQLGHEQNRQDLDDLAQRYKTGNWAGRFANGIFPVQIPAWEFQRWRDHA